MKRSPITYAFLALALLFAVLLAAGCGEESTSTQQQQVQCDPDAPSIIPAASGKPMLVYFFRDT